MELKCHSIEVNSSSIIKELILDFKLTLNNYSIIPLNFTGFLKSSDGKKISNLQLHPQTSITREVMVEGVTSSRDSKSEINFSMSCEITDVVFNHIEKLRHSGEQKDINFYVILNVSQVETKLQVSSIYFEETDDVGFRLESSKVARNLIYKYARGNYQNNQTDLYILSTLGSANMARVNYCQLPSCPVSISYTDWVKVFVPYFSGHSVMVFELPVPPYQYIPKKMQSNFGKAVRSMEAMKKHYERGEWKALVVEARVIYETFKKFKDFEDILLNSGYSTQAVTCINEMITGLFGFISKVHHAYQMNSKTINDDIEINREDAIYIYANCNALLNLISEKSKRLSI